MVNSEMEHLGKEKSAIRELFEQGKILKKKYGEDLVYDFSIGNPSIPCPKIVNDTIRKLVDSAEENDNNCGLFNSTILHGYTSAEGDIEVRTQISKYLNETYNADTDGKLIYMTSGAAAGITITLKALTSGSGDDEVIVFAPYFPEYKVFTNNANAKLITVNPDFKNFYPSFDDFEKKITKNTSIVIINSPNNPTGVLYNEDTIKKICEVLKDKQKLYNHPIYILSDEPYRELIYNDTKFPFITNYYDNSIVTYSFSKSISLPGERIGYILVNKTCENVNAVFSAIAGAGRSLGYVCVPTLFQFMIPYILGTTSDLNIYKNNSVLFYNELKNIGYKVIKPDGAFYLFMKALDYDDIAFSKRALYYNLLIVPSTSFGISGYVRIAYCVTKDKILSSIPKFKELFNFYTKTK